MGPVTETIEERAAREALELDADGWRRAEAIVRGGDRAVRDGWDVTSSRAMLAYRDKVATGLVECERDVLCGRDDWGPASLVAAARLRRLGLHAWERAPDGAGPVVAMSVPTPFGREVARILEAPGEAE